MTKIQQAVVIAAKKGYWVSPAGDVFSPKGKKRKLVTKVTGKDARIIFSITAFGKSFPVPVHRLVAYQLFGDAAFTAPCVRHLDGDSLNNRPENIALGTHRENALDRTPEDRAAHAKHAASFNIAYDWAEVEKDHAAGLGFKKLSAKYGMSVGTLSHHFNRLPGWKPIAQHDFDWDAIRAHILSTGCSYLQAATKFECTDKSIRRKLGPQKDLRLQLSGS